VKPGDAPETPVGRLVRLIRQSRGQNQETFARELGLKRAASVSEIETGRASPSPKTLAALARISGLTTADIRSGGGRHITELADADAVLALATLRTQRRSSHSAPTVVRERPTSELSQTLRIRAKEFELEAVRAGADEREMSYILSVLYHPEAIYRSEGYREPLTAEQKERELDSTIRMLRGWLEDHVELRGEREGAR